MENPSAERERKRERTETKKRGRQLSARSAIHRPRPSLRSHLSCSWRRAEDTSGTRPAHREREGQLGDQSVALGQDLGAHLETTVPEAQSPEQGPVLARASHVIRIAARAHASRP